MSNNNETKPRRPGPSACRPFEHHEVPLMLEQFTGQWEYRNKALLTLGINTGFRISELLALRVNDVYNHNKVEDQIRLPRHLMKGSNPRRPKRIFPEAKFFIRKWVRQMKREFTKSDHAFLFRSQKKPVISSSSVYHLLNKAAEDAGLSKSGIGTHSLRKTFANAVYDYWDKRSRAGERVEPMRQVQLELGHESIDDTYRYMAFRIEDKDADIFAEYNLLSMEPEAGAGEGPHCICPSCGNIVYLEKLSEDLLHL